MIRKTLTVIGLALITALFFEGILQGLSLAVHLTTGKKANSSANTKSDGSRIILCLGDSYTFGMGASEPDKFSYPAQLQVYLNREHPGDWTVINGGFPGKNSSQMAKDLRGHFEGDNPPEIVILTGGVNDSWSNPEQISLSESSNTNLETPQKTFRWEFRSAKLLRTLAVGDIFHIKEQQNPPLPVEVAAPPPPEVSAPIAASPTPPEPQKEVNPWTILDSGHTQEAIDAFYVFGDPHTSVEIQESLVIAYKRLGNMEKVNEYLNYLEIAYDKDPSDNNASRLVNSMGNAGATDWILENGPRIAGQHPEDPLISLQLGNALLHDNKVEEAKAELIRGKPFLEQQPDHYITGRYWRTMSAAYSRALPESRLDLADSLRYLVRAHETDSNSEATLAELMRIRAWITDAPLKQALADENIGDTVRTEVLSLFQNTQSTDRTGDVANVTRFNFSEMIRYCRSRGSRVVLGNYPFIDEQVIEVMDQLSEEFQLSHVPVYKTFQELLKTEPNEELFVSDGHCTDRGYGIMADLIFEQGVAPLLND